MLYLTSTVCIINFACCLFAFSASSFESIFNYLLIESEVFTGKSQTELRPCRIDRAIARSIQQG